MPSNLPDNLHISSAPQEFDASGNPIPIVPANIAWSLDASGGQFVSFVQNPDGSATWTPIKIGSAQATVKDTKFNLSFTDTLTVIPGAGDPTMLTIVWGTPS
jgi:hypothetical protein